MVTTGMVFCAYAASMIRAGVSLEDSDLLDQVVRETKLDFDVSNPGQVAVAVNGHDYDIETLHTQEHRNVAPVAGQHAMVREIADKIFRGLAADGEWVIDRGQRAFPEASLKFWLEASLEERAARRAAQLALQGVYEPVGKILEESRIREERDRRNPHYRYGPDKDAIVIPTSGRTTEQVYQIASTFIPGASS